MKPEEIVMRQEIRQMLNEVGINKNTLKDMVKEVLNEAIENAIKQTLKEKDIGGAITRQIDTCVFKSAEKIVRDEIHYQVRNIFYSARVNVDIQNKNGNVITGE